MDSEQDGLCQSSGVMTSFDENACAAIRTTRPWICCQLGAREHYSIPRGLHQRGLLAGLFTETWVPPNSILARIGGKLGERLSQRYDEGLADANVYHASSLRCWLRVICEYLEITNGLEFYHGSERLVPNKSR